MMGGFVTLAELTIGLLQPEAHRARGATAVAGVSRR